MNAAMKAGALALAISTLTLGGCAVTGGTQSAKAAPLPAHPEARVYTATRDAKADVDAGLARAAASGKHSLIVLGANWCHDSRAFAGWMETPRFQQLISRHYEVVYVNIGMPQTGDGRNLHIARRFGIERLKGTPAVLVLSPTGAVLNAETATTWRNTANRSEDAIYRELAGYVTPNGE